MFSNLKISDLDRFSQRSSTASNRLARISFRPGLPPTEAGIYHLLGCQARLGEVSGRLRHELSGIDRPAVGDWVAVADDPERAVIHQVLRRRTAMIRRAADTTPPRR